LKQIEGRRDVDGFYWLIDGSLAGCRQPGIRWSRGVVALEDDAIADDLLALRERGIAALLTLTEEPLPTEAIERAGMVGLHLPVPDFDAPSPDQLRAALAFIDRHQADGGAVAVHCMAGQGRTGTVLAAHLIRGGRGADEAIVAVRAVCPGAIESKPQVAALHAFAAQRDWIV
jgi:atypical dual specificity phosphatase